MFSRIYIVGGQNVSLEYSLLGFLSERARSGYDLKTRCFDDAARAFWTADQAQIYRTLERLKDSKLVTSTRKRQTGKPDRKVYAITLAGRDALASWTSVPAPLPAPREPFLLQLFFSAGMDDAELRALLAGRRGLHQARLDDLREQAIALSRDHALDARTSALRQVAFDGAIAAERAAIDWLDDTLDSVSRGLMPGAAGLEPGAQNPLFGWAPA